MNCGPLEQQPLELGRRDDEAAEHGRRHHVRRRRLAGQRRDLAEELSASEPVPLLAVDLDPGLALEDDVEVPAAEAPPKHALTRGEDVLVVRVGDRLELRGREVGEQRELPEAFGDVHG